MFYPSLLLFAYLVTSGAVPLARESSRIDDHGQIDDHNRTASPDADPPATYSCDLDSRCGIFLDMEVECDTVINDHLWRVDNFNYTIGKWPESASANAPCTAKGPYRGRLSAEGAGMTIEGPPHCKRTGNQIWYDYQDIKHYGCKSCGYKSWGADGRCRTVINYKTDCPRTPAMEQGPVPTVWPPES